MRGKSISERSNNVWRKIDPSTSGNAKVFLDKIFENQKEASKTYTNAYYVIIVLGAVYWVIVSGSVTEFSFLSIKLSDIKVLIWVIPILMSFAYYQGTCAFFYELFLLDATDAYFEKYLPDVSNEELHFLTYPPSFYTFERIFSLSALKGRLIAVIFAVVVTVSILILPTMLITFFIYKNLRTLDNLISINLAQSLLTLISIGLLIRTCALIISMIVGAISSEKEAS
jgi:hypothetical protein